MRRFLLADHTVHIYDSKSGVLTLFSGGPDNRDNVQANSLAG